MIGEALALFSAFCWALNGTIYRLALRNENVVRANFIRVSFTSIGFMLIMLVKGELTKILTTTPLRVWMLVIASAICAFFIGDVLYMESIKRCGVSRAVPLSSTYPLFVALWSFVLHHEIELQGVVGALLVITSIYLIVGEGSGDVRGYPFALAGAVFWSVSITIVKALTSYLPPEAIAGFRFLVVSVLLLPMAGRVGGRCAKLMMLSALVMIVGNYAFVLSLSLTTATRASTLSALYPIIAQFMAMGVKEKVTLRVFSGAVLAFLGVAVILL